MSYSNRKQSVTDRMVGLLYRNFIAAKMQSIPGIILLGLIAIAISFAVYKIGFLMGLGIIGGILGLTIAAICLLSTELGYYIIITISTFIFFISRLAHDAIPAGVGIDVLIALNFLGIYFQKTINKERYWSYSRNPITYVYFLFIAFMLVELFNPSMYSIAGWVFAFRKMLNFVMIYFIGLHVFKDMKSVKTFMKVWLTLMLIVALYGCYQHIFGLPSFEYAWVSSDPIRLRLYLQAGVMRDYSFLSDPTSFGIIMASSALIALVLAMGPVSPRRRNQLLFGMAIMGLAMGYSGTRTAYAMVPAGAVFFMLMTITSRRTLAFAIIGIMGFVILVFGPFYNSTAQRIRSTFRPTNDESFSVRDINRHRIQPYIYMHPLGGGLSTAGVQGEQYNPGHPLAGFPPDSGLLKSAVETGWVGLALSCLIYFVVLQTGISNYYKCQSKEIRNYYAAGLVGMFSMVVAQYSQVAIGQIPGSFLFYGLMPMMVKLITFDKTSTQTQPNKLHEQ
ncbi:O-Antigen ligase [Chitinophaga costaii]|uniref:O-Antigen ligase n=1 Tax=Chitinophaga costaii TaxID=1335309 RepID=A0A1C4FI95_9BACT|nr:O-antigen ligase family protein [Chitinophaga costaii]PUZ20306.1 O-antigen ligase domain-containing protein [Chitinophaga costaii]SCC55719.1 O-Antigen ligase [Chitinophaga costaii]